MTVQGVPDRVAAYGLARPGWTEAQASLQRVFGPEAEANWRDLLATAGISQFGPVDDGAFARLLAAFGAHPHPVVRLCGRALGIRVESFRHLADAHELIRSIP